MTPVDSSKFSKIVNALKYSGQPANSATKGSAANDIIPLDKLPPVDKSDEVKQFGLGSKEWPRHLIGPRPSKAIPSDQRSEELEPNPSPDHELQPVARPERDLPPEPERGQRVNQSPKTENESFPSSPVHRLLPPVADQELDTLHQNPDESGHLPPKAPQESRTSDTAVVWEYPD